MSEEVERTVTPLEREAILRDIRASASDLAVKLRDATEAGVSHALILPALVLVFRETFGTDFALPDMAQLAGLGGGS